MPKSDPDLPPLISREEMRHGTAEGVLDLDRSDYRRDGTLRTRAKRGMLAWLNESLAVRVVDEGTGVEAPAGRLIADRARDLALEDPLVAVKLADMTLRAQEAAAQADDDNDGPQETLERVLSVHTGPVRIEEGKRDG